MSGAVEALSEIFAHFKHSAQAPGHSHDIPGIWDKDIGNGDKGGTACEWCATWERARACITTPPARSYADGGGKVEQPLCNTVPDRIYLLDCGSGDISWCDDPDPGGANDDAVAVEYARVGVWRKPVEPDDAA